jgi:membrane-associated phospholipid phosphatase
LIFVPYLLYHKLLFNVQMENRRERYVPLVVSFVLNIFCYYLIRRITIPQMYYSFILSSLIAVLVTMLITLRYKISIHMVGAGGLVALIGFLAFHLKVDLQFYLVISLVLAGITGTARLILKAHTPDQIYTGFLTGFSVVLLTLALSQ